MRRTHPGKEERRAKMGKTGKERQGETGRAGRGKAQGEAGEQRVREFPPKAEATEGPNWMLPFGKISGLSVLQRVEEW